MFWFYWILWGGYVGVTIGLAIGFLHCWFKSKQVEKEAEKKGQEPFVSVLVTLRNEEDNIEGLLSALLQQTYSNYEVVLVDDRSEDRTWHILQQYGGRENVILVQVKEVPSGFSSRKWAIHQGVLKAKGEWIFTTDSDCIPPSTWVESLAYFAYRSKGDVIIGYSPLEANRGFFHAWVQFENNLTAYLYYGLLGLGFPFMGVGRNLGFRRDWYHVIQPYSKNWEALSGSDDFLVQASSRGRVIPCLVPSSFVPYRWRRGETMKAYIRRRQRHFSAFRAYPWGMKVGLSAIYLIDWGFLLLFPLNWKAGLVGFLFRILSFWLCTLSIFSRRNCIYWYLYPVFYLLWLPYHLVINFSLGRKKERIW